MHDLIAGRSGGDPLSDRLAAIRASQSAPDPRAIEEVVRAVLQTMTGDLTIKETSILTEIEELGRTIASAKAEIQALRVDDITMSHIPFATDELDAIVAHTASATNAILESCEILDEAATAASGEVAARLQDATTKIYEACSFQDITGQRITKVVATLKAIETKVAQIIRTFGGAATGGATIAVEMDAEDELLNGPQLPAMAMDQSDIDKLMASFD